MFVYPADRLRKETLNLDISVCQSSSPNTHGNLQDAAKLAQKVVANYGLSEAGITVYAPPGDPPGFGRKSFEVAIDNIDADLFGRAARVRPSFSS